MIFHKELAAEYEKNEITFYMSYNTVIFNIILKEVETIHEKQ